jgi:heme/copper-type cytochrome/quinol oxidase subunit 2
MRARQLSVFAILGGCVLLLVSGAAISAQDQGATRQFSIVGSHYAYAPPSIEVNRNDLVKITFTADDIAHSFTVDPYRISKRAGAGQSVTFEFRADQPGTYTYYCNLATDEACKNMKGRLIVH